MPVVTDIDALEHRHPERIDVDPMFVRRWSPRAMNGEAIRQAELETLFEAARWAPSCANSQPWRFIYAHRDTDHWPVMFELLAKGNRTWCEHAGVLILMLSRTCFERNDGPAPTHGFDTGAAWMSLAMQASRMGLVAHGMRGFDEDKAIATFGIPDMYKVQAMAAIGRPGEISKLPEDLQARETPSSRKALSELILEGQFNWR